MWSANITGQNLTKGVLQVTVEFTNGTSTFAIIYDMSGGTIESLNQRIVYQLGVLNANDILLSKLVVGPFTPPVKVENIDPLQVAMRNLQIAKQNVDLGIITESDAAYTTALSNAKDAYSNTATVSVIK